MSGQSVDSGRAEDLYPPSAPAVPAVRRAGGPSGGPRTRLPSHRGEITLDEPTHPMAGGAGLAALRRERGGTGNTEAAEPPAGHEREPAAPPPAPLEERP